MDMEVSERWCEDYDTVNIESAKIESLQLALKAGRARKIAFWLDTYTRKVKATFSVLHSFTPVKTEVG